MLVCRVVFGIKITFLLFLFIWVRGSYPRVRYDQFVFIMKILFTFEFLGSWGLFLGP